MNNSLKFTLVQSYLLSTQFPSHLILILNFTEKTVKNNRANNRDRAIFFEHPVALLLTLIMN